MTKAARRSRSSPSTSRDTASASLPSAAADGGGGIEDSNRRRLLLERTASAATRRAIVSSHTRTARVAPEPGQGAERPHVGLLGEVVGVVAPEVTAQPPDVGLGRSHEGERGGPVAITGRQGQAGDLVHISKLPRELSAILRRLVPV